MRHQLLFLFVVGLTGCGGGGGADPAGSGTGAQTEATPTDETMHTTPERTGVPQAGDVQAPTPTNLAPVAPAAAGETHYDAHGITVTRKADGTIHVEGTDRWGARMDITYADAHYYKHAVDVLGLSITPEQERALQESLPTIAPEALHDRAPPQPAGAPAGR